MTLWLRFVHGSGIFQILSLSLAFGLAACGGGTRGASLPGLGIDLGPEPEPSPTQTVEAPPPSGNAPATPTVLVPAAPVLSNASTLSIAGTCETGATVNLAGGATDSVSCTGGSFSFTVSKSVDGAFDLLVSQSNSSGTSGSATVHWVRDTEVPVVTSVSSSSPNGTYSVGGVISIQVTYSEALTLAGSGTPDLLLETGGTDRAAVYASGGGTNILTFTYTVQSGDMSSDLDTHASAPQINLHGRTLQDAAGNNASLTMAGVSLATNKALIVNSSAPVAPVITSPASSPVTNNASSLTIAGTCTVAATVDLTGDDTQSTTCTGGGTFTFSVSKSVDDTYDFSVTQTDGNGTSGQSNVQWIRDTAVPAAPTITTPASSPVTTNANSQVIAGACVTGNTVNLTGSDTQSMACASSAYSFTVSKGSDATYSFSVTQTNANGTSSAANTQWIRDTAAPTITNVSSSSSNGTYYTGDTISIQVTYSKNITVTGSGTPTLLLETGSTDRTASYTGVSGATVSFSYTVQTDDSSSDLDTHASGPQVTLNGRSFKDSLGNDASLTVAGTSLATNKAIVVSGTAPPPSICDSGNYSGTCVITTSHTITSDISANHLDIQSGGSLVTAAHNSNGNYNIVLSGDLLVRSGGSLHGNFTVTAANLTVDSGGVIKADAKGAAGSPGWTNSTGSSGGAGHGGAGSGNGDNGCGGGGYGLGGVASSSCTQGSQSSATVSSPMSHGGGGGGGQSATTAGGNGGGHIKLIVSTAITINGTVSANGGNGLNTEGHQGGGGGGGSVWIDSLSASITGSGTLAATGGNAGGSNAGGGGGGFLAISAANPWTGGASVDGGTGGAGSAGNVYLNYGSGDASGICASGNLSSTCTISSLIMLPDSYTLSGSGNLVLANGGELRGASASATYSIAMSGNLTVQSGGKLTGNTSSVTATNISINSGGLVSANGYGCLGGSGSWNAAGIGCGPSNAGSGGGGNNGGGGGGHGGNGGGRSDSYGYGTTYGSNTEPVTRGSGGSAGGAASNNEGGNGGGRLKIIASGTLTVDGTISADGTNGLTAGGGGGGGSGGSVWLGAATLNVGASGIVRAKGGDAGNTGAGGGGGGRVAYYYSGSLSNSGSISAGGGSGGANAGSAGSTYGSNTASP